MWKSLFKELWAALQLHCFPTFPSTSFSSSIRQLFCSKHAATQQTERLDGEGRGAFKQLKSQIFLSGDILPLKNDCTWEFGFTLAPEHWEGHERFKGIKHTPYVNMILSSHWDHRLMSVVRINDNPLGNCVLGSCWDIMFSGFNMVKMLLCICAVCRFMLTTWYQSGRVGGFEWPRQTSLCIISCFKPFSDGHFGQNLPFG